MKRRRSGWVAAALCMTVLAGMAPSALGVENHVTGTAGPTSSDETNVKWTASVGSGGAETTAVAMTGGSLYVASGSTLYRVDKDTGEIQDTSDAMEAAVASTELAPTVADGKVFVALRGGQVEAFDAETLEALWVSEKLNGEITCPIVSADGRIFTGTAGADSNAEGRFVCLTTSDDDTQNSTETKNVSWSSTAKGGFDGAGAYVSENCVVYGSKEGKLYSADPKSGENIDTFDAKVGTDNPIMSSIVEDSGALYFACENGILFRVALEEGGMLGEASHYDLGGPAATTPTVANDRIYVGVSGASKEATSGSTVKVLSYDDNSKELKSAYSMDAEGFLQGAPLAAKLDGGVCVYFTTNQSKGALYSFIDSQSKTSGEINTLYTPQDGKQAKTAGSVQSENGVLYYSTVNGSVFALEKKEKDDPEPDTPTLSNVSAARHVKDTTTGEFTLHTSTAGTLYYAVTGKNAAQPDVFSAGKTKSVSAGTHTITLADLPDTASKVWMAVKTEDVKTSKVKSDSIASVVKVTITLDPTDAVLKVKRGNTGIEKQSGKDGRYTYRWVVGEKYTLNAAKDGYEKYIKTVTAKTTTTSYKCTLLSKNCKLEQLAINSSYTKTGADFTMQPAFAPQTTSYIAATEHDIDLAYLWLRKSDSSSSCYVYGTSGVSRQSMRKNTSLYAESYNGYQRCAFRFKSGRTTATLTVKVKAADKTERSYVVKVKRTDKTAPKLTTITNNTGRTGASNATLALQSTEKATGYFKVANPGVVPTKIVAEGISFAIKKGQTTLKISGLASTERNIYIIAVDKNGNKSTKTKIVIPAYSAATTKTAANSTKKSTTNNSSTNNSSTNRSSSWLSRISSSTSSSSTGNTASNGVTGGRSSSSTSNSTNNSSRSSTTTADTGPSTSTEIETDATTGTPDSSGNIQLWNSADDMTTDTGVTDEQATGSAAATNVADTGGSGSVPDNSVISGGTPAWRILLVLVVICGIGFGVYWYIIRRKNSSD